jgi:hypothetical protein
LELLQADRLTPTLRGVNIESEFFWFVQDGWRATRSIAAIWVQRYEVDRPFIEAANRASNAAGTSTDEIPTAGPDRATPAYTGESA